MLNRVQKTSFMYFAQEKRFHKMLKSSKKQYTFKILCSLNTQET